MFRILNTIRVPDNFSSRLAAIERSYIYRFAVFKKTNFFADPASKGLPWGALDYEFCSAV
jgi:tRNA U38,U39,U40 pseudouridine synthase TruA